MTRIQVNHFLKDRKEHRQFQEDVREREKGRGRVVKQKSDETEEFYPISILSIKHAISIAIPILPSIWMVNGRASDGDDAGEVHSVFDFIFTVILNRFESNNEKRNRKIDRDAM